MRKYSFLQEDSISGINKVLATASMTALGSTGGSFLGRQAGDLAAKYKYSKIDPDSISWSDPSFLNIVRNSLYKAKNDVKVAREWYLSCDRSDKFNARMDYLKSIETYKEIQRDIADRNPFRWITDYKKMKSEELSNKYKGYGKAAGTLVGGIGTGYSLFKK